MRRLAVLALLCAAACTTSDDTYLVVRVERGTFAGDIDHIDFELSLGARTATVTARNSDVTPLVLPLTDAISIGSGSGAIHVKAVAFGVTGPELVHGSGDATINRGDKIPLTVTLGVDMLPADGGVDAAPPRDGAPSDGPPSDGPIVDVGLLTDAPPVDAALPMTVAALRQSALPDFTVVTLPRVVVVARVASASSGKVWVQDPGGGPFTGIQLFCPFGGVNPCPTGMPTLLALNIGDVISVTGAFQKFLPPGAPAGAEPVLEVSRPIITTLGTTMAPVALPVPAASQALIAKGATGSGSSLPYQGSWIHLTGATFTVESTTASEYVGSVCAADGGQLNGARGVEIRTSSGALIAVFGQFFAAPAPTLSYCGPQCPGVTSNCTHVLSVGMTVPSLSGILEPAAITVPSIQAFLELSPITDADLQ